MSTPTQGKRGIAPYRPSWEMECGGNPSLNEIFDAIDAWGLATSGDYVARIENLNLSTDTRLDLLENDWHSNTYGSITVTAGSTISNMFTLTFTSFTPKDYLKIGSVVKFKVGGVQKYGYVVRVGNRYNPSSTRKNMEIIVPSDNTIAPGDTITDLYYGENNDADGFPKLFKYVPTVTKSSGSGTFNLSGSTIEGMFSIRDNKMSVWVKVQDISYNASDAPSFYVTMPLYAFAYGDLNGDNVVDVIDSSIALFNWDADHITSEKLISDNILNMYQPLDIQVSSGTVHRYAAGYMDIWSNPNNRGRFRIECKDTWTSGATHTVMFRTDYYFMGIGDSKVSFAS